MFQLFRVGNVCGFCQSRSAIVKQVDKLCQESDKKMMQFTHAVKTVQVIISQECFTFKNEEKDKKNIDL